MTDSLTAVILGIVEGITEFLPVSSTGHLLITEQCMSNLNDLFKSDLFNIVIQTGAVLAVIPLFHKRFHQFIFNWADPAVRGYFYKIVAAFVITGAGGYVMEKKGFNLHNKLMPVGIALLVGGVLFLVVETWLSRRRRGGDVHPPRDEIKHVTWTVAIAVGLGQLVAARYPGSSRSGTTILFMLILGLSRPLATEYSFLVSIPTMLAAGGYKIFEAFHHKTASVPPGGWNLVILATLVAAVVSFIAVKWLLQYVQTHTFIAFGLYRIILGGAVLWFVIQVGAKPSLDHGQIHSFAPVVVQHLVPVQLAHAKIF
jgi:undecaprenyl-diphosphatase